MNSDIDFHGYFDWAATTPPDSAILQDSLNRTTAMGKMEKFNFGDKERG